MVKQSTIKRRNEKFKSLTKEEQRVVIAKDVIAQIKEQKYIPSRLIYVEDFDIDEDENIQENFDKIEKCNVCALGSLILSCTKFVNTLTFGDIFNENKKVWNLLSEYFSKRQLVLMEYAFEGFGGDGYGVSSGYNIILSITDRELCRDFFYKNENTTERLKAIMKNIIKNNGTFKL